MISNKYRIRNNISVIPSCLSFIFIVFLVIIPLISYCQKENTYDEITVKLMVQHMMNQEIPAIIYKQEAYLSVKELFDFLKIKNTISSDYERINGFFIDQKDKYVVDRLNNQIVFKNKTVNLEPSDLISNANNLYLKSNYFGQIFGLNCRFDFRNLLIILTTQLELPAIREMRQEQLRKNISLIKGERDADTTISRHFSLLQLGIADWTVTSTQVTGGKSNARANLTMGAFMAGGEVQANLNYFSDRPFYRRDQFFRWRYVNNNHSALRQIIAGQLFTQSISSLFAPVNGIQFTNTPTTYRQSFGNFRISNTTEPGWMVELYVNNVLVNYVKADASGFYTFDVPMVYGNSAIKLRIYGPLGEERTLEQNISIPFNFLPAGQFEYNVSAGLVEDHEKSIFARTNFNYGLNKRITIGGGAEYLSSVNYGKPIPFVNASLRLGRNLIVSYEYDQGVRQKGTLNYRLPSDIQLDVNYTKYEEGQTACRFFYLEERKAVLTVPFHLSKLSTFSRFTYNQLIAPTTKNNSAEFLFSAAFSILSLNITSNILFTDNIHPYIHSNLSLTVRLPKGLRISPHIQYQYNEKKISIIKTEVEKRLGRIGFLSLSYENNIANNINSINVGLRLNFSFAQTSFNVLQINNTTSTIQSARGSLIYNDKTNHLKLRNDNNTGKGGLIISPFLDINCNGRRDENEPKVFGLKLRVKGGRVEVNKKDTTITIWGLEAYAKHFVEMDKNNFDYVSWQLKNKTMSVTIEPNHYTMIEIPIAVVGEVTGNVFLKGNNGTTGLAGYIVNFYNSDSLLVGRAVTESDGYFSFMGLAPGNYTANIDSNQLHQLRKACSPILSFNILSNLEGDIAEGLEFTLESLPN